MERHRRCQHIVVLIIVSALYTANAQDILYSFSESSYTVTEGASVTVNLQRTGVDSVERYVPVILTDASSDFIGVSLAAVFAPSSLFTSVTFTTIEDDQPEPDESFTVYIQPSSGIRLADEATTIITIGSNDDAAGVFSFNSTTVISAFEGDSVAMTIGRDRGSFGSVLLRYSVSTAVDQSADLSPVSGTVVFSEGQISATISFVVIDDEFPENEETVTVSLSLDDLSARIGSGARQLRIMPSDCPIRFTQSLLTIDEASTETAVHIELLRGRVQPGSDLLGNLDDIVQLSYTIRAINATQDVDFRGDAGAVTFGPGQLNATIDVQILPDDIPELMEEFTIELTSFTGDGVIIEPRTISIRIQPNDDPNGVISFDTDQPIMLDEDGESTEAIFVVHRTGGVFGSVTVNYQLSLGAGSDLYPVSGQVPLNDGVAEATFTISAIQDSIPEGTERFVIALSSVSGGARLNEPQNRTVIIEDSDLAHGAVQWSLTGNYLNTTSSPRRLWVTIERIGGSLADVQADFLASYLVNDEEQSGILVTNTSYHVTLASGHSTALTSIPISDSAYLAIDALFKLVLTSVKQANSEIETYNSPVLGEIIRVTVPVTERDANGVIGFQSTNVVIINEPHNGYTEVLISLIRNGVSGQARVQWALEGVEPRAASQSDVRAWTGAVTFNHGVSTVDISIKVEADTISETEETMKLSLTSVLPSDTQRLNANAKELLLVIEENDSPGGVFQLMTESIEDVNEGESFTVTVERTGGALVQRSVFYSITPDGSSEFYGSVGVLTFAPGQLTMNTTIIVADDDVPEIGEHFTLTIQPHGSPSAELGSRTSVNVTIRPNDAPYGLIRFQPNSQYFLYESKGNNYSQIEIPVVRDRGLFETVSVTWAVLQANASLDLTPTEGMVIFLPGQSESSINITSLSDKLPEDSETFEVSLGEPTGGAEISQPNSTIVNIIKNDAAIFFQDPSNVEVTEGTQAILKIARYDTSKQVSVGYRTMNGTAGLADYSSTDEARVVFPVGVSDVTITVSVSDDNTPEPEEVFYIELVNPWGDAVIDGEDKASVLIKANDQSNGLFRFAAPHAVTTREGTSLSFIIMRERGLYEEVIVDWMIVTERGNQLTPGSEFDLVSGSVKFGPEVAEKTLELSVLADGIPEYDESYSILLTNASGGGPAPEKPGISSLQSSIVITVTTNDDPNGVVRFQAESRERTVAEDVLPGVENNDTATTFTVTRGQGSGSEIQVLWELFSDQVAGVFPEFSDLLFRAESPDSITRSLVGGRPSRHSQVFAFSGESGSFTQVPTESQNLWVGGDFALSLWTAPSPGTSGYILSKTSADGNFTCYSLKLTADLQGVLVSVILQLLDGSTDAVTTSTALWNATTPTSSAWQNILINVHGSTASFIFNGVLVAEKSVPNPRKDVIGSLTLGASSAGLERYEGQVQDLRLYSRALTPTEIMEVVTDPAHLDVTPTTGTFKLETGETSHSFSLSTVQDVEAESNEVFSVKLVDVRGGARLSTDDNIAKITILKSDNANGLFGFENTCLSSNGNSEGAQFVCMVRRDRGDADRVQVSWLITQFLDDGSTQLATTDFANSTGLILFQPGQLRGTLRFVASEDHIPELTEHFKVILTSALPSSGPGTTPESGASINPEANMVNLTIQASDLPYGLLQFSESSELPPINAVIVPAERIRQLTVPEDIGFVSLLVERARGLIGTVTAEWRTEDGTASSSGQSNTDYMATVGSVVFSNGQRYSYINISIIDDTVPEAETSFFVHLLNPTGGAELGEASTVKVTILESDEAYGVFSLDSTSRTRLMPEAEFSSSNFTLTVERTAGSIGISTVHWQIYSAENDDFEQTSGQVTLQDGQRTEKILVAVRADTEPELDETFSLQLINATRGRLGPPETLRCSITILANDDPYGVFSILQSSSPTIVHEYETDVMVSVVRSGGAQGQVNVTISTVGPELNTDHFPVGVIRADVHDFIPHSEQVTFEAGDTIRNVSIMIVDDLIPESDESLFVALSDPILVSGGQSRPLVTSPRLAVAASTFGQIVISSNDNANGILALSATELTVSEDVGILPIFVNRTAGSFGEVTVRFEVIPLTATTSIDYFYISNNVLLSDGETYKQMPIQVNDDSFPELAELFTIRLLDSLTGGATLGAITECNVTISQSDDPYGSFGFALETQTVEELETASNELNIRVNRMGGSMNIVSLQWIATYRDNGELAEPDIDPASGVIYFTSGQASQYISLQIKADALPENTEVISINLTSATNGGRINDVDQFLLTIPSNDNPHGSVQFNSTSFDLDEGPQSSLQHVYITRSGGLFGELIVYYSTVTIELLDLSSVIKPNSATSLWYYDQPIPGARNSSGNPVDVSAQPDPLQACAEACLLDKLCLSFLFNPSSLICQLFQNSDELIQAETHYYAKISSRVRKLYNSQALSGSDYSPVTLAGIVIPDQVDSASLPITVLSDVQPELDERFYVRLDRVELSDRSADSPINNPRIGSVSQATAIITSNDDANGVLIIYSRDPRATENGQRVSIEERQHFSLELVVERIGGAIGDVSVAWIVNDDLSTASRDTDYVADGATLTFPSGEISRVITIGIQDDITPELNEEFTVELRSPTGGALLGDRTAVMVVILANDEVAGRLGFDSSSYISNEGEIFDVVIERTEPARGVVMVDWNIVEMTGRRLDLEFSKTNGQLVFNEGETNKTLSLQVLMDEVPEVREEYQIQLTNVTTIGVPATGQAVIDLHGSVSSITVSGSDDPHGILSFSPSSIVLNTEEGAPRPYLVVNRKFGSIGVVRVYYRILSGSLRPLGEEEELAILDEDVWADDSSITIGDNEQSGRIYLNITDDLTPEVKEVFLVNLTGVELISHSDSDFKPSLAGTNLIAEVSIAANDGTRGQLSFASAFLSLSLNETELNLTLSVVRDFGAYGEVSAFIYSRSMSNAILGQDFQFEETTLVFQAGERQKDVTVTIFDDDIPENSESFELVLASPLGGATLSDNYVATITIAENDGAGGYVQFTSESRIILQESLEAGGYPTSIDLIVARGPGLFGLVAIDFTITDHLGAKTIDIEPANGSILFNDQQSTAVISLHVVDDVEPELEEHYVITLDSRFPLILGSKTQRNITIIANDSPHGKLSLKSSDGFSAVSLEETDRNLGLTINRERGAIGIVSVDVVIQPQTAFALPGDKLYLASTHRSKVYANNYCSYDNLLVILNRHSIATFTSGVGSNGASLLPDRSYTQSELLMWNGMYTNRAYIETNNPSACIFFSQFGSTYLLIANRGAPGATETVSRLYRVHTSNITVLQEIPTQGADDVISYKSSSAILIAILNTVDNSLSEVVNVRVYELVSIEAIQLVQNIPVTGSRSLSTAVINNKRYAALLTETQLQIFLVSGSVWSLIDSMNVEGGLAAGFILPDPVKLLVSAQGGLTIHQYNGANFEPMRTDAFPSPASMMSFTIGNRHFLSAKDMLYSWNGTHLAEEIQVTGLTLVPLTPPTELSVPLLLGSMGPNGTISAASLLQKDADYFPMQQTITFLPGITSHEILTSLLDDEIPEPRETFLVSLTNPVGGAVIDSTQSAVTITILANDNAYGAFSFAENSLTQRVLEGSTDAPIQFNIERTGGTFTRVVLSWQVNSSMEGADSSDDVFPSTGLVEFSEGQTLAEISVTILADGQPERDEYFSIELVSVVDSDPSTPELEASIGEPRAASLIILSNESPHGVISWERSTTVASEPDLSDISVSLRVVREQGRSGALQITYITSRDEEASEASRATSGEDYISKQGTVVMADSETAVTLAVIVKGDDLPETDEQFLVNLTSVRLLGMEPVAGIEPSIRRPGDVVTVIIAENDDARGVVQLDVERNSEGRLDAYEVHGEDYPVNLKVVREIGAFGTISVEWQVIYREASSSDISPDAGLLTFSPGQTEAFIEILVLDDSIPEPIEMFDVQLLIAIGGAAIGSVRSVRIAIVKNDSPNGMFGFEELVYNVREHADDLDDAQSAAVTVTRTLGYLGVVNVGWQLAPNAHDDFDLPRSGILRFEEGESSRMFSLFPTQDGILEGKESFVVSLTSVDNNADLSVTHRNTEVNIEADPGSSGVVKVSASTKSVIVAEPDENQDGTQVIRLERVVGLFGDIMVTWVITPFSTNHFLASDGEILFADGQFTVEVTLQTRDDNEPEPRQTYIFSLTSATGGAQIDSSQSMAVVHYAASNQPFGIFQFETAESELVPEDVDQISVSVIRLMGVFGQVRLGFEVVSSSAARGEDFQAAQGFITFVNGQTHGSVALRILDDDLPEGPETFYVNLTSALLISPTNINFTLVDGVMLDQPPEIGPINSKPVTIDKNDNAEGVLQFAIDAEEVVVREEEGVAVIPVVRSIGDYGPVGVIYTLTPGSAQSTSDFISENGTLSFQSGVTRASINVTIPDDLDREPAEDFYVTIVSTTGGALLGGRTQSRVVISKSDYPNGRFHILGPRIRTFANPTTDFNIELTVRRSDGIDGLQTLSYRLLGPNSRTPLLDITDIAFVEKEGNQVTASQATWADKQNGDIPVSILIKAFFGWEIQKTFVLEIYDVHNDVSTADNGEVDPDASSVFIVIAKHGDPNGIIRFSEISRNNQLFNEGTTNQTISYYIERTEGDLGDQEVLWEITGGDGDLFPMSGTVIMSAGVSTAVIRTSIISDGLPELAEEFQIQLHNVIGGATLQPNSTSLTFTIQPNDDPHGRFEIFSANQSIGVNPVTLVRTVNVMVKRNGGNVGVVRVTFSVSYSREGSDFPTQRSITFADGQPIGTKEIPITEEFFFPLDTYFTINLTEVNYISGPITSELPVIGDENQVSFLLPSEAANSLVGFAENIVTVDEMTNKAFIAITRVGSFGKIEVWWASGYPSEKLPEGFNNGNILPSSGSLYMGHGVENATIEIDLIESSSSSTAELFALSLPLEPSTTAAGGAQLHTEANLVELEPHGVIRFTSLHIAVNEEDGNVILPIKRLYGTRNSIQVTYQIIDINASADDDFIAPASATFLMEDKESTAEITIPILNDIIAEQAESFLVNLTRVIVTPTTSHLSNSPRISRLAGSCEVTIAPNGDPYGVFNIQLSPSRLSEAPGNTVRVTVHRSAGRFGTITVRVRSVGGGEPWDDQIAVQARSNSNNTISEALSNRDTRRAASAGADYQILNEMVTFEPNQVQKEVTLYLNDDGQAEPDEQIFVYLSDITGGARVAKGSLDGQKYGYGSIEIIRNEDYNGIIGFSSNSQNSTIDEDTDSIVTLTLTRTSGASFTYDTTLQWEVSSTSNPSIEEDLKATRGIVTCLSMWSICELTLELNDDSEPEFGYVFTVRLFNIDVGARVDPQHSEATIHVLPSDNPYGAIQFNTDRVIVSHDRSEVRIQVDRNQGLSYDVSVSYGTEMVSTDGFYVAGVKAYSAVFGTDYNRYSGTLAFESGINTEYITIELYPGLPTSLNYPKIFKVVISNPQFGAVLGEIKECTVVIVDSFDEQIWDVEALASSSELDDQTLDYILTELNSQDFTTVNTRSISVLEYLLNKIITAAEQTEFSEHQRKLLVSIFCNLMSNKVAASKGRLSLIKLYERFIFSLLVGRQCESEQFPYPDISCSNSNFGVAKIYPSRVNGYQFSSTQYFDTLKIGDVIQNIPENRSCNHIEFIEYNTDWWFKSGDYALLNNRVLATNILNPTKVSIVASKTGTTPLVTFKVFAPDGRRTDNRAQCVYYDEDSEMWTAGRGVCAIKNELELGTSTYVECECSHLSSYAVTSLTRPNNEIGYPSWMFIIAGICMCCLLLTLMTYFICPSNGLFTVKITMHLVSCVLLTLVCYICSALLSSQFSPENMRILASPGENNYRCIIMGVVFHYFILAQFTWILIQSANVWNILTRNDEYTERFHWLYVLLGYGLPLVYVGGCYGVTYYFYTQSGLSGNFIYGNVNNENEMCFLSAQYPALGGVVAPMVFCCLGGLFFIADVSCRAKQWKDYDDIYKDKTNKAEVWALAVFWLLIILTNITGGLHMAYNYFGMMIAFCICLAFLAMFAALYLTALRGPCINCLQPHKVEKKPTSPTSINSTLIVNAQSEPEELMLQIPQIAYPSPTPRLTNPHGLSDLMWERDDDGLLRAATPVTMQVKRTPPPNYLTSTLSRRSELPTLPDDDDTRDLGQLILALKDSPDRSITLRDIYSNSATNFEAESGTDLDSITTDTSHQGAYDVLRRISIADTHL